MEKFEGRNEKAIAANGFNSTNEKRVLMGLTIKTEMCRSKYPSHPSTVYYFLWNCNCGKGNIALHYNEDLVICRSLKKVNKDELSAIQEGIITFSLRKLKHFCFSIDWCRSCLRQIFLVTKRLETEITKEVSDSNKETKNVLKKQQVRHE